MALTVAAALVVDPSHTATHIVGDEHQVDWRDDPVRFVGGVKVSTAVGTAHASALPHVGMVKVSTLPLEGFTAKQLVSDTHCNEVS
jgi:hypothetical protein